MQKDHLEEYALSSTIILVRDRKKLANETIETLMVQRSAKMGFAAGAIVFPGGKVDEADQAWVRSYFQDDLNIELSIEDQFLQRVTQIAAIRELFEEAGIILCRPKPHDGEVESTAAEHRSWHSESYQRILAKYSDLEKLRRCCNHDAAIFYKTLNELDLVPNLMALDLFARWRTPPGLSRRFETWFFLAAMPENQRVKADGTESTETIWASPNEFLEMGELKSRKIIFPTRRNLELLSVHNSYAKTKSFADERSKPIIEPTIIVREGEKILTIPEGLGYPIIEEKLEKALRD